MKLKRDRNVLVYLILICFVSQGFGRSFDVQEPTGDENNIDRGALGGQEEDENSDNIDNGGAWGRLEENDNEDNKLYSNLPPASPENSQQRYYSPETKSVASKISPYKDNNFAVETKGKTSKSTTLPSDNNPNVFSASGGNGKVHVKVDVNSDFNTSNLIPEKYPNSANIQNDAKLGSLDASLDYGKLKNGNSTEPSFLKTFRTINIKQVPREEQTGNYAEHSDSVNVPKEENNHDASADQLAIGESVETQRNNVQKTKIVQGENGSPKKLKIEHKEVKQIFHWNSKTTPAPKPAIDRRILEILLANIRNVDSDVKNGEVHLTKRLRLVNHKMRNFMKTAEKFQPLDEDLANKLINATLVAAEAEIQNLCIAPIRETLRVPKWTDWSSWGTCTLTCGRGGYRLRHRNCLSESQRRCLGNSFDIAPCDMEICPAIWLSWGHWSHCSASCNHGLQVRTRTCLTSNVKLHCMGSTAEVKDCYDQKCPAHKKVGEENTSINESTLNDDRDGTRTDDIQTNDDDGERNVYESTSDLDGSYGTNLYPEAKRIRGKAQKETMLSVGRTSSSDFPWPQMVSKGPIWSSWTGWSVCQECGVGNRDRKRICLNSTSHLPVESSFCSGAEIELSPCSGSACPLEREFPSAPHVSEGGTAELKCGVNSGESIESLYWITPRTRHIMHQQADRRIHMFGTSLLVTKARFCDQGQYRCVQMFRNGEHRVQVAPLIVETCADHNCENGGQCLTSADPQFEGFKQYQCKCTESFKGTFCQQSVIGNKLIAPILISVLCLLFAIALCIFLVFRSIKKSEKKNPEGKIWKKFGRQKGEKKKKKSADNSDVTNTSVVSNDDSFVEVTADDLDDIDMYEMPQQSGSGGFFKTDDGYMMSPLKYPSPRQKLTYGLDSQNDEEHYIQMDSLPQKRHVKKIKFSDEDEEAFYETVPYIEEPLYENVPVGKSRASGGKMSPQKRQRPTPEEVIDKAAEEIAQQCLIELQHESQRAGTAVPRGGNSKQSPISVRHQSPSVSAPYRQSPNKRESRASQSPAQRAAGYRTSAGESPSYNDQGYSKVLAVKDKHQEAEFLKHFDGSLVPKMQTPNTSTPKKEQSVRGKKVILPSDILNTGATDDLTLNKVKKNLAKDMMIVTPKNIIGQQQQNPKVRGHENVSNNGHTQATPSECEVYYDESSYHSADPQSDFSSRRESFLSANSASLRTLPDVDSTISFPKLSSQQTPEAVGSESGNQFYNTEYSNTQSLCPNQESGVYPYTEGSSLYPNTEGSVYLSDYHYTPEPSELYISPSSNTQDSEDEDELSESGSSDHNSMALRYQPRPNSPDHQ